MFVADLLGAQILMTTVINTKASMGSEDVVNVHQPFVRMKSEMQVVSHCDTTSVRWRWSINRR